MRGADRRRHDVRPRTLRGRARGPRLGVDGLTMTTTDQATPPPPPPSPIAAVLADVDGTLVTNDKVLTPQAIQAVKELHAREVLFAITSGRPPRGMRMLIEPLELKGPIAAFNGGIVVMPDMT